VAIFAGATGLIFLLQGIWTWSSAASFQKIVGMEGNDIGASSAPVGGRVKEPTRYPSAAG
jgi:hypothetical protein